VTTAKPGPSLLKSTAGVATDNGPSPDHRKPTVRFLATLSEFEDEKRYN
jgi:hypothetical protein